jgi:hypothetical protein
VAGGCLLVLFWPLSADPAVAKVRWQVAYLGIGREVTVLGVQTESGNRQVTRTAEGQRRVHAPIWSPTATTAGETPPIPGLVLFAPRVVRPRPRVRP